MLPLLFAAVLGFADPAPIATDVPMGRAGVDAPATVRHSDGFEAVGVSWSADARCSPSVSFRASADGLEWSEPVTPMLDDELTNGSEGRFFTGIVHFGKTMTELEYRFAAADGCPTAIDRVQVTFFAPPPAGPRLRQDTASYTLGNVPIRSRTDWGCPDGEATRSPAYTMVTHLIVHHTAGGNELTDWDAEMRNIWYYHTMSNGWSDIGYNYLIAPNGVIYEGRGGGDGVLGAHFSCRNTNTAGISLLGTYSTVSPTPAAVASLGRLLGELARRFRLDPSVAKLHAPSGLMLGTISAHRDGNAAYPAQTCTNTECPGNMLYVLLPQLREAAGVPPAVPSRRRASGQRQ